MTADPKPNDPPRAFPAAAYPGLAIDPLTGRLRVVRPVPAGGCGGCDVPVIVRFEADDNPPAGG